MAMSTTMPMNRRRLRCRWRASLMSASASSTAGSLTVGPSWWRSVTSLLLRHLLDYPYQLVRAIAELAGQLDQFPRLVHHEAPMGGRTSDRHPDRKSTRLNSSHLVISY